MDTLIDLAVRTLLITIIIVSSIIVVGFVASVVADAIWYHRDPEGFERLNANLAAIDRQIDEDEKQRTNEFLDRVEAVRNERQ